jgi:hypothetical protein
LSSLNAVFGLPEVPAPSVKRAKKSTGGAPKSKAKKTKSGKAKKDPNARE